MMGAMTSSATSRPHLPGASTRPQSVRPSVIWAYLGAAMAVVGVILAVSLVLRMVSNGLCKAILTTLKI